MRLSKTRRHGHLGISMTPMIDIVFLLIIFFMTVSQITYVNDEPLELPKLEGTEDQEGLTFTINVNRVGDLVISGKSVTVSETMLYLGEELAAHGGDPSSVRVMLRCDHRVSNQVVNQVVRQLTELGIQQVRVGVQMNN